MVIFTHWKALLEW